MKRPINTHFELNEERKEMLEQATLSRYSVNKPNDLVLETLTGRAFIEKGTSQWKFSLSEQSLLTLEKNEVNTNERIIIKAEWFSSKQADKKNIIRNAGKDANIFDGMGALLVPDNFKIPIVLANKENIKFYGLELIENGSSFPVVYFPAQTVLMEYDYKPNYKEDFLTQESGGGGYYVETHNFPHIHIPLSPCSKGHIIIGKKISANQYSFSAYRIPYGYGLYTPPGTIHGDGTLIGKYAITVASSKEKANTVLFFNKNTLKKIDDVV